MANKITHIQYFNLNNSHFRNFFFEDVHTNLGSVQDSRRRSSADSNDGQVDVRLLKNGRENAREYA